jgi:hypothetical protein
MWSKQESAVPLGVARQKQPLTDGAFARAARTPGRHALPTRALQSHLEGEVILPVSELNRMRRDAVAQLDAAARATGAGPRVRFRTGTIPVHPSPGRALRRSPGCPRADRRRFAISTQLEAGVGRRGHARSTANSRIRSTTARRSPAFARQCSRSARHWPQRHLGRAAARLQARRGVDPPQVRSCERRWVPRPQLRTPRVSSPRPHRAGTFP